MGRRSYLLPRQLSGAGGIRLQLTANSHVPLHTKHYRTKLHYLNVILGNFCSVIIEPICFWNY